MDKENLNNWRGRVTKRKKALKQNRNSFLPGLPTTVQLSLCAVLFNSRSRMDIRSREQCLYCKNKSKQTEPINSNNIFLKCLVILSFSKDSQVETMPRKNLARLSKNALKDQANLSFEEDEDEKSSMDKKIHDKVGSDTGSDPDFNSGSEEDSDSTDVISESDVDSDSSDDGNQEKNWRARVKKRKQALGGKPNSPPHKIQRPLTVSDSEDDDFPFDLEIDSRNQNSKNIPSENISSANRVVEGPSQITNPKKIQSILPKKTATFPTKKTAKSQEKAKKSTRKVIGLDVKLKVIKQKAEGAKNCKIAVDNDLHESSIRAILKKKDDIEKQAKAITASGVPLAKNSRQLRTPALIKMERLLTMWLQDLESRNFPVSLDIIREKARRLFYAVKENLDPKTEKEKKQQFKAWTSL